MRSSNQPNGLQCCLLLRLLAGAKATRTTNTTVERLQATYDRKAITMPPTKSEPVSMRRVIWGMLVLVAGTCAAWYFLRDDGPIGKHARDLACRSHLSQIAYALRNFRDNYGCYPPVMITDENGKPLHSWRVLILPYIEQQDVYQDYDFLEPWDGKHNSQLASMVDHPGGTIFRCTEDTATPVVNTSYLAVVKPDGVWSTVPQWAGSLPSDELLLVEVVPSSIHWMEPKDITAEDLIKKVDGTERLAVGFPHRGSLNFIRVEGRVEQAVAGQASRLLDTLRVGSPRDKQAKGDVPAKDRLLAQLEEQLRDSDAGIRHCAALLLGQLGGDARKSVGLLRNTLRDEDPRVRLVANLALKKILGKEGK